MNDSNKVSGNMTDHAGVAFHPPVLLVAAIALGVLARWLVPLEFLPSSWAGVFGPVLTVLALTLFAWSVLTMLRGGASIPTGQSTEKLVFAGPYRFSRNPIYLSMVSLLIGIGTWSNSAWFLLLAVAAVVLLNWGVISREERYLERKFGVQYTDYLRRVRRWC